jgi:DNA-binding transcriptional ArsR family regulator
VSRQAIAKHLGVLRGAGLVTCIREGREARYAPAETGLTAAERWLSQVGAAWDRRLARLSARATRENEPTAHD